MNDNDKLWKQSQAIGLCSACDSCPVNGGTCHGLYGNLVVTDLDEIITSECYEYVPLGSVDRVRGDDE